MRTLCSTKGTERASKTKLCHHSDKSYDTCAIGVESFHPVFQFIRSAADMGVKQVLSPNRKSKYLVLGQDDQIPLEEREPWHEKKSSGPNHPAWTQDDSLPTRPPEHGELSLKFTDNFLLQLLIVIGLAVFFRRLWILHGITVLFLHRMLTLGFRWFDFFVDTGVFDQVFRITRYIFRFAFKNTEKALQGDSLRILFAASWLQNYNAWGRHVWLAILREQYKHVNRLALSEMEGVLERAKEMQQKNSNER
eukprot:scaffold388_cov114-Cylindrotheca_fusiformis.AAC.21